MAKNTTECDNCFCGLLLPLLNETGWDETARMIIYLIGLLYSFLGVAIIADRFMCAIEKITSKTRRIEIANPSTPSGVDVIEVEIWNGTVANLTLMALGSSAPEIMLSCIEIIGNNFKAGALGPGTIVGSAAFNLLCISAICVMSIPSPEVRRINVFKVFLVTAVFSIFAYIWLLIVLVAITPDEVELWEGVVTFLFFPLLVVLAYLTDKNFFLGKKPEQEKVELGLERSDAEMSKLDQKGSHLADGKLDKESVTEFMKLLHSLCGDSFQTASYPPGILYEEMKKYPGLTADDAARLAAARVQESQHHDTGWYRVSAIRKLTGGKKTTPMLSDHTREIYELAKEHESHPDRLPDVVKIEAAVVDKARAVVEFEASSGACLESEKHIKIMICRHGNTSKQIMCKYETIEGTAEAGKDYISQKGTLVFEPEEKQKFIDIEIIDDNQWEPNETFFVKLSVDVDNGVILGHKSITQITIINDDDPGIFDFSKPSFIVKESIGKAQIPVIRHGGADGKVSVRWQTRDKSAYDTRDYIGGEGFLQFEHGETEKMIEIKIIDDKDAEKDEHFEVKLLGAEGGAQIGKCSRTIVTIVNDDDFNSLVTRVAMMTKINLDSLQIHSATWGQQFEEAMNVNGGDIENASNMDYVMHFLTFGWKIIFALVPPPGMLGGWLCFFVSLGFIGILTAIIGDLASIFGCLAGLKDEVTAITFVALGTSLPDTFASRQAALTERYADSCIGNITGSNSVNVFLGLGLPWLIASIYWHRQGKNFSVPSGSLAFSVTIFTICAVIAIGLIIARRFLKLFGKGELGGPTVPKFGTAAFLIFLWFMYVLISALQSYEKIPGF